MPSITVKRYTRAMIQANPDKLYVFGDNIARTGYGGQANAARDEPNAVGIPTKRGPYVYLEDTDYAEWLVASAPDFARIVRALNGGATVVWPEDGIGTGLAELAIRAPKIWDLLQEQIRKLGGPAK